LPHPAHAALPLIYQGKTIGGLALSFATQQVFAESDRTFLLTLAQMCANSLARARLYEEERTARTAAEQTRQQRDMFVAIASHELRSPLAAIRGFAQLAARRMPALADDDGSPREALEAIERQTERMAHMIEDLLDLGRIEAGTLALERIDTNLRDLVNQAVALAQPRTSRHRILVQGPNVVTARLDPPRIEQVLSNLLNNAITYSPDGGQISVDLTPDGQSVRIDVRDHGVGIPADTLPYVFDPFYRAAGGGANRSAGLGLGLFICREIVVSHGGHIEVSSPPDGGTLLTVTIPCSSDDELRPAAAGLENTISQSS
jgi:signal transduction histidine kinase